MKKSILISFLVGASLATGWGQPNVDASWNLATNAAPFPSRFDPATVVFKNKLWVIGGRPYSGPDIKDIWSSSNGNNWERVTDAAACLPRLGQAALVFKDKLWIIAGATPKGSAVFYSRSDVWSTSDGIVWEKTTDSAAFPARVWHAAAVFDGKMWVFGGTDTRKVAKDHGDAWYSEDGVTWTLANASAFSPRAFLKSVVFQNKLWILGGNSHGTVLKDIISSSNGITWATLQGVTGFNPTDHFFLAASFNDQVWIQDQTRISNSSDMLKWNTVTGAGPYGRLGLLEMSSKLWSIGAFTKGTTTHPVYSFNFPGPVQPKATSRK